ncbi:hypothetical protein LguiB_010379 [Lonicera macranthoides]
MVGERFEAGDGAFMWSKPKEGTILKLMLTQLYFQTLVKWVLGSFFEKRGFFLSQQVMV